MKKIAFAFLCSMAVLSFAGCKKKGGGDAAVAKAEEFKTKACKCKAGEKECADKVIKEMMEYGEKNKADAEKWAKDTALMAKVKPISDATQKCIEAAMAAGATDPGSAAPGSADPGSAAPGSAAPAGSADPAAGSAAPAGSAAAPAGSAAGSGSAAAPATK